MTIESAWVKAERDASAAAKVREIVEAGEDPPPNPRALPLDPIRVRGLPAHMSGAPGAIRGTDPVAALLDKERQRERRKRRS